MIAVEVEDEGWRRDLPDVEAIVKQAAETALISKPLDGEGSVTILLTDDEAVGELNARFRGKDQPTNVLSFPAAQSAWPHLGDVALAHGVCAREAAGQGKTLLDHLRHLVIHGVLHLLDYDHETDAEAEAMEGLERRLLAALGVADPYRQEQDHARA